MSYGYYSGGYGYTNYFEANVYLDLLDHGGYVNVTNQNGSSYYHGVAFATEAYYDGKYYGTTYANASGSYFKHESGYSDQGELRHTEAVYYSGTSYYEAGYSHSYSGYESRLFDGFYAYFHSSYGATTTYTELTYEIGTRYHDGVERMFEVSYTSPYGQSYSYSGGYNHL